MVKQGNISIVRDSSQLLFTYKKRNPASATGDYFDSSAITAASIKVIDPKTDAIILASTGMTYSATIRGYRFVWTPGVLLDGLSAITVEVTPTRAGGVSATLTPIDSDEFELADILQRIEDAAASNSPANVADAVWDEAVGGHSTAGTFGKLAQDVEVEIGALQTDFNSYETINQGEHDATQTALAQIGATARTQLLGPTTFQIPDSGTSTFILDWTGKDTDASPTILDDPDDNIVDITVVDQTGSIPIGVSLAGTPAGRMTRNSLGRFQLQVSVDDTAVDGTQLRFTAASTEDGAPDVAIWTLVLGSFDQLDDIQAQVNAIRSTDVPAIQAHISDVETRLDNGTYGLAALQAEHDYTQALLENGTFGLLALKTILDAQSTVLTAFRTEANAKLGVSTDPAGTTTIFARLRQIVETYLADSTHGLAALDTDLNLLLNRLGITTDTGATITTGTVMAKLNVLLAWIATVPVNPDIEAGGSSEPQP